MKGKWLLMASALLCPALAGASSSGWEDVDTRWWLGIGIGGGAVKSAAPAPSADRNAVAFSIDGGFRITPQWGLGLEYGAVNATSGCGGRHCTPAMSDFAPDFTRLFAVGEYRPVDSGVRIRAGAGISSMCYQFYKSPRSAWDKLLDVFISGESMDNSTDSWNCKSLRAFGIGASIGYQWPIGGTAASLGLQLRGEAARFAASTAAGTPAFQHRALMLQLQLNFN